MAKATPEQQAIEALAQAAATGTPKVLFGTAKKPGIFPGSPASFQLAAQLCLAENWLEPAGEYEGHGSNRKEKYRVTPQGAQAVLERSEPVQLLRQALAIMKGLSQAREELFRQQQAILDALVRQQETTQQALQQQQIFIEKAVERLLTPPPTSTPTALWREEALHYLQTYQAQHVQAFCSLAELYAQVVSKHDVSIGQFHDGIRALVQESSVRLHPFTGGRSALANEAYALLADKEIMYYAERIAACGLALA